MLEHTAGKFPLWLTPNQVVILPVSEKFNEFAENISNFLNNSDIRSHVDLRNEKVGKKIRDNELKKIPYLLILGQKEIKNKTLSVRKQGKGDIGSMLIDNFVSLIKDEVKKEIDIKHIV